MEEIRQVMRECLTEALIQMTLSGKKTEVLKIKVRPIRIKNQTVFQVTRYIGQKVFHENMTAVEGEEILTQELFCNFTQCQIQMESEDRSIRVSKKGKIFVTCKKKKNEATMPADAQPTKEDRFAHNRKKAYLLQEGTPVPFLVDLGVMSKDGHLVKAKYDKFRQINRFLEYINDVVPILQQIDKEEITILDFGCGKSYLTYAVYYFLHELQGIPVRMIGLDLKEDVITHCAQLAEKYGYDKLQFLQGDVAEFALVNQVDMVITLHACDTATDYALEKAVKWGASVIMSVPCCQHEVNKQIKNKEWQPVLKYGLIKERISALLTDAIRGNLLEQHGYKVQLLEFIDLEHTPKNILIRGVKKPNGGELPANRPEEAKMRGKFAVESSDVSGLIETFALDPTLVRLLKEETE